MKNLFMVAAFLGLAACGRACCMEKCQSILYTCQRDSDKEMKNKCFEVTTSCIEACRTAPEN